MPPRTSEPKSQSSTAPAPATSRVPIPKLLARMRDNPKGDWTVKDIETICDKVGMSFAPPSRGSHFKVSSQHIKGGIQVIPAHKPIKPPYIRAFLGLVEAHLAFEGQEDKNG